MFYDDNGFRDMFIYGSMAMLAVMAMPSSKAHAAEFYLCGDGRTIELNNSTRPSAMSADSCVISWYTERQKQVATKGRKTADGVQTADAGGKSTGYQIQTSAIEPLINAVEVPENKAIIHKPIGRDQAVSETRMRSQRPRKTAMVVRPAKGLRNMGDGIFAQ